MGTRTLAAGIIFITAAAGTTLTVGVSSQGSPDVIRAAGVAVASGSVDADPHQDRAPLTATVQPIAAARALPRPATRLAGVGWGAYRVVAKPCLNIRPEPGTAWHPIACRATDSELMSDGTRMRADEIVWLHVEKNHDNQWGWAAERYLHLDGECGE